MLLAKIFNFLASRCSLAGWFGCDPVENPEDKDMFSHDKAQILFKTEKRILPKKEAIVTGCRKIPTARGGNRTWTAGSKGKHYHVAVKAGFHRSSKPADKGPLSQFMHATKLTLMPYTSYKPISKHAVSRVSFSPVPLTTIVSTKSDSCVYFVYIC